MKTKHFLIPAVLLLCGCSQNGVDNEPPMPVKSHSVVLQVENQGAADGRVSKVNYYLFRNGVFQQSKEEVPVQTDGSVTIQTEAVASNVYFVTNIAAPKAYATLVKGVTTEEEFKQKATDVDATHSSWQAPEFYTGFFALKADGTIAPKITLATGLSRVDVDATSDLNIKVTKISVEKAAATTFIFPGSTKLAQTKEQSYERELTVPSSGLVVDALRLYECDKPVTVFVWGLYNEKPIVVTATLEKLDRGKVYTLKLRNGGISVEGVFDVEEWLPGDQVDANPDPNSKITIEPAYTTLPSGVTLDASNTTVSIPYAGTSTLVLGFAADDLIEIEKTDGLISDVTIGSAEQAAADGKVITRYAVSVNAQGAGRLPYQVVLHLKHALRLHSYDVVTLSVAAHPTQIPTVEMCGNTWMAFNARSPRLDDQIYVLDGLTTVKEMYEKNWVNTIGGLFQWGRMYMHTPWLVNKNNAGSESVNAPWNARTHMPCPEGYRVPTVEELRKLLPPGTVISANESNSFQYTTPSGEIQVITTSLCKAENTPASIQGVTGPARYVTLHNETTGAEMYIPLSGQKGDKAEVASPQFGYGFTLWSNSNSGVSSGWANTLKFWPAGASQGTVSTTGTSLQAEGYAYVRCIKE